MRPCYKKRKRNARETFWYSIFEPKEEEEEKDDEDDLVSRFTQCSIETVDSQIERVIEQCAKKRKTTTHVHSFGMREEEEEEEEEREEREKTDSNRNKFDFPLVKPFELFPHQVKAIEWIQNRENNPLHGIMGGLMSLEMGLGKTLVALSLIASDNYAPNLFLCNKSLLGTISNDTRKFFGANLPFFVLHKDMMKVKMDDLNSSWFAEKKFILTTYDVLVTLGKRLGILGGAQVSTLKQRAGYNFFSMRFHRVICDESQRFVNSKSHVFKCVQKINSNFRLCLTGTPILNYDRDLHSQLSFCGLNPSIKWSQSVYNQLGLRQAIYSVSIADANIKLPEKETVQLDLQFTQDEQVLYDHALQKIENMYNSFTRGGATFAAVLVQFTTLRHVCISPYLTTTNNNNNNKKEDGGINRGLFSTKVLRLVQIVKKTPQTDKMLIFSSFTSVLALISDALNHHLNLGPDAVLLVHGGTSGKVREVLFNRFRTSPTARILLLTNTVGCMGLNLTEANHVILVEPWWNNYIAEQAAARVWRIGQTKKVYVWKLIMKNSIEERMLSICMSKNENSQIFLNKDTLLTKEVLLNIFQL